MSEVSDTLFDMLSLEQKTFLSMKCTLYQDNWERLCSYMDSVKDDAVLQYRDRDKARAALYMTKVQLSALRVHDITNQDRVVITRVLYSNSKMYHILRDYIQNEPTRCKACRIARKNSRPANGEAQQREMYETTCAQCGAPTRVPFIPKNDRPIYCSECYASRRASRY